MTINFSVHVCVKKPTREEVETDGPDAGWLAVTFPAAVKEAMIDSWFGFEENCGHGYCARVDFKDDDPRRLIEQFTEVEGILDVSAQDPKNCPEGEEFWCPCERCGIGPFDDRDEPEDSLLLCNDCVAAEEEAREDLQNENG